MPNDKDPHISISETSAFFQAEKAWKLMQEAKNIAIISHRNPDPDTIGSSLTLKYLLSNPHKQIQHFCVNSPPKSCEFIMSDTKFEKDFEPHKFDLLITVDCGSVEQTGYEYFKNRNATPKVINIDHHQSNNNYGDINIVDSRASSTTQLLFDLIENWHQPLTPKIATALLIGLYYDTGSFMHSNVSAHVLDIAAKLTEKGANTCQIRENLYRNFSEDKYKLWGEILQDIHLNEQGHSIAIVDGDNYKDKNVKEELSGIIDYLSSLKNSKFAILVNQEDSNNIRGSLRTQKNDIDLSQIAALLGGGGHKKASGFGFKGKIKKQYNWKITNKDL